jgi:virginiamycin B lyase
MIRPQPRSLPIACRGLALALISACGTAGAGTADTVARALNAPPQPTLSAPTGHAVIRPIAQLKLSATIPIGKTADWVVVTSDAVWVGSTGPYAVNKIDPKRDQRVATVELPGEPCAGLAVGFSSLWVPLCGQTPKLAQVDLSTHALVHVFDVGPAAPEGGITTGAGSVWMVLDKAGSLARIDPISGRVRQIVHLPPDSYNPYYSDRRIWVTRAGGAELTSVDAATGRILGRISTGPGPRFLTAGAGAIWTLNQGDGSLSRVDRGAQHSTRTLALGTAGHGGDITYGAGRIWTTFPDVPLSIVDAAQPALLCQWRGPGGDSLGFGAGAIWLTNYSAGTLSRIALSDIPPDCDGTARRRQ